MRRIVMMMSVAVLGLLVQAAQAGDCGCAAASHGCAAASDCCDPCCNSGCCDPCGNGCNGKRCELKVGKKKIKVVCYGCECDEVCLPCPSKEGCSHCENICENGACCDSCDCECGHKPICKVHWKDWCPGGAQMYPRKKLVKYEAEKEVCDYKWVVVDCGSCCGEGAPAAPKAGEDKPPMPPVPTPVSTTKARRVPSKAAPKEAQVGQEFPLTDAEIKMVESQIQQTSHETPVSQKIVTQKTTTPARQAAVKTTTPAKAPVKAPAKVAGADQVPWSLFNK